MPVPLALIVATGLRCLNLTLDSPVSVMACSWNYHCSLVDWFACLLQVVAHISPQHHAAVLVVLPRIWTAGLLLIGCAAKA